MIYVFDKGRIVEKGSHEQLIKKNGHYLELWTMQAQVKEI
jgi:ABC-type multidrug transport system fused ATPase/permease subunit